MIQISKRIGNKARSNSLHLQAIALSGYLPNGLCNGLPILKGLYLSYNKLHDQMPTSLTNCSQLQILSLSDNEFDGPIHSEIERSSNLQILALGIINFTGIIPQEIENLVNLAELAMERNQISGSFPISTLSHRCNVCHCGITILVDSYHGRLAI
ncbi:hypothetical protein BC332_10195 [Capsicum chinense]|nr:hypothetical protein BC332_10195 [Capsicum chinense]